MQVNEGEHHHSVGWLRSGVVDPWGRPADYSLLSQFVGALTDECQSCADALVTLVAEDSVSAARLVELACLSVRGTDGGLPRSLTDAEFTGPAPMEFRYLARAGDVGTSEDLFRYCAWMNGPQRRLAAWFAARLLVSQLGVGA